MKESELRECATCSLCFRLIGESQLPLFWRVRIERYGINMQAVHRQTGLAMLLGNADLARVMGPDEEMAVPVMDPVMLTVCETCAVNRDDCVAALAEIGLGAKEEHDHVD